MADQQIKITGTYRNKRYVNQIVEYLGNPPKQLTKGWTMTVRAITNDIAGVEKNGTFRVVLDNQNSWSFIEARTLLVDEDTIEIVEEVDPGQMSFGKDGSISRTKTDEEILEDSRTRFAAMETLGRVTALGQNTAFIISGSAGLGKSYLVEEIIDEYESTTGFHYETVRGYMKATGLYKLLYKMRHPNCVLVLDDNDKVFQDEVGLSILKAALDTTNRRFISWQSQLKMFISTDELIETDDGVDPDLFMDDEDADENDDGLTPVPNKFEYQGSMIFITNIDIAAEVQTNNKLRPHMDALLSRCHYLDVGMRQPREKFVRIRDVINNGMLRKGLGPNKTGSITLEQEETIINFIENNLENFRDLSLRTALKLAQLMIICGESWEDTAKLTCLK